MFATFTWCSCPSSPGWSSPMWPKRSERTGRRWPRARKWTPCPPALSGTRPCTRSRFPRWSIFKTAQITCTAWLPIVVSFATGWLAGILGIGGGLIRMPALIYFIGCPTHVAVGTDLFEVMISGLYGTATYTYKGRTELVAAMIMLCGAAIGAQMGTVATKYIKGYGIRIAFGLAVIGCALSILLKMMAKWFPAWGTAFDVSATVLILGLVAAMSLYIGIRMIIGAKAEVAAKKAKIAAAK